jgi:hypothetical protein
MMEMYSWLDYYQILGREGRWRIVSNNPKMSNVMQAERWLNMHDTSCSLRGREKDQRIILSSSPPCSFVPFASSSVITANGCKLCSYWYVHNTQLTMRCLSFSLWVIVLRKEELLAWLEKYCIHSRVPLHSSYHSHYFQYTSWGNSSDNSYEKWRRKEVLHSALFAPIQLISTEFLFIRLVNAEHLNLKREVPTLNIHIPHSQTNALDYACVWTVWHERYYRTFILSE